MNRLNLRGAAENARLETAWVV